MTAGMQSQTAQEHLAEGNALQAQGKYDEAIGKYQEAVKHKPDYAEAYFNWGNALYAQKNYDEAIGKYQEAVKHKPDYAEAYNNWGNALQAQGKYDEAIGKYQEAVKHKPDYAEAYFNWGNTLYAQKHYDEAIGKYQEAVKHKPDLAEAYNNWGNALYAQKHYDEAIGKYEEAVKQKPDFAEAYNNWGLALHAQGKHDEAIGKYQEAVKQKPDFAEAYFKWGNALYAQNKYYEAIEMLRRATRVDRDFAYAYHNIGAYLWNQGKYQEGWKAWGMASSAYERSKQKAAEDRNADYFYYYGSVLYEFLGEIDKAEEVLSLGLSVGPDHPGILSLLVDLYLEKRDALRAEDQDTMRKQFDPLIRDALRAVDEDFLEKRAKAHSRAREYYAGAKGILEQRLTRQRDPDALLQLGELLVKMEENADAQRKKYSQAENHFLCALPKEGEPELDSQLARIYGDLGVLYTRREDYKRAARYFQDSLDRNPNDLAMWSNLAEAYLKLKQKEAAEAEYKKILAIAPDHIDSRIGLGELYTAMGEDFKDEDMYQLAIRHYDEAITLAESKQGSKRLKKRELAAVYYAIGYARGKLYESSKLRADERLLSQAKNDFQQSKRLDPDLHKAARAVEKLDKRLSRFSSYWLTQKLGPWLILIPAFFVLASAQSNFFFGKSHFLSGNSEIALGLSGYATLTFGSLVFIVVGLYLPQILKLKVAGIELEKSSVDQITTPGSLGISK